jgi:hypothetical protein
VYSFYNQRGEMVFRSIDEGLKESFRQKKLVFLFWLMNLFISLIFLFPYLSAFNRFFSKRIVSRLLEHANVYTFYHEFFHFSAQTWQTVRGNLFIGKLLILMISLVLSAGVISAFLQDGPVDWKIFWSKSLKFLGRMLKFGVLQLFLFVFLLGVSVILFLPVTYLLPSPFVEDFYFYFFLSWACLACLFVLLAFLLFDLSRIQLIYHDSRSVLKSFWTAVISLWKNPLKIYILYFLLVVLWAIIVIFYWNLQLYLRDTSAGGILLKFVILQFFIWIQYWIRLSRFRALIRISGIAENQKMVSKIG